MQIQFFERGIILKSIQKENPMSPESKEIYWALLSLVEDEENDVDAYKKTIGEVSNKLLADGLKEYDGPWSDVEAIRLDHSSESTGGGALRKDFSVYFFFHQKKFLYVAYEGPSGNNSAIEMVILFQAEKSYYDDEVVFVVPMAETKYQNFSEEKKAHVSYALMYVGQCRQGDFRNFGEILKIMQKDISPEDFASSKEELRWFRHQISMLASPIFADHFYYLVQVFPETEPLDQYFNAFKAPCTTPVKQAKCAANGSFFKNRVPKNRGPVF